MSDRWDDSRAGDAFRDGLRRLPVPPVSPDFDARVLASLERPQPLWQTWWREARLTLCAGAASLFATLFLVSLCANAPAAPPALSASPPLNGLSFDRALDQPTLRADSLVRPVRLSKRAPVHPRSGQARRPESRVTA